jgi:MFS family permease
MSPSQTVAERPARVRYWVIVFAVTLAAVTYVDRVAISFAAPSIRRELGLTAVQMGWAFAAFNWAYAMFEIPGGYLGDWIGPRKVLMRIVLWWSTFTTATGWAWSFPALLGTRFLFGAGEAGCFPNVAKAFTTWLPAGERVRAQGIMWLSARWAGAFTPPLVALVMGLVGWRHAFEIFGCLGVVWAALFFFWFRDDPMQNPKLNAAERELLRGSSKMAAGHGDVPWGRLVRSQQVWMLCGQFFRLNYGWWFYVTWLPTTSAPRPSSNSRLRASPAVAASIRGDDSTAGCALGLGFAPRSRRNSTAAVLPGRRAAIINGVLMSLERALTSAPWAARRRFFSRSVAAHMRAVALASFRLLGSAPCFNRLSNVGAPV